MKDFTCSRADNTGSNYNSGLGSQYFHKPAGSVGGIRAAYGSYGDGYCLIWIILGLQLSFSDTYAGNFRIHKYTAGHCMVTGPGFPLTMVHIMNGNATLISSRMRKSIRTHHITRGINVLVTSL